jgi:hypothetical protein
VKALPSVLVVSSGDRIATSVNQIPRYSPPHTLTPFFCTMNFVIVFH